MTALAAGASVTVAVRDSGIVAISTNGGIGSAVATTNEGTTVNYSFGPAAERRVLSGFAEGASIVITNQTCPVFDYDAETRSDSGTVVQFAKSAVAVSPTGTTAEVVLLTVTIPGGLLTATSALRVSYGCSYTNNANSKTVRLKFGGTTLRSTVRATSIFDGYTEIIRNRGSSGSQHATLALSGAGATQATAAIDTTVANDLVISIQLASAGDTATLEQAIVEILP